MLYSFCKSKIFYTIKTDLLIIKLNYINEKKYQNTYKYRLFMIKRNNYYAKYSIINLCFVEISVILQ